MSRRSKNKLVREDPSKDENNQWVMLMNKACIENSGNNENKPAFCRLQHPKTGSGCLFLFTHDDKKIQEVIKYSEEFRSWFIGELVQSDGSLMMTTPVDPVYLILPYLITASKSGKFMQLEQILHDSDFPACTRLCSCVGINELSQVADVKGDEDLQAYRYNQDTTLSWLKAKVNKVAEKLEKDRIALSENQVSTFVKTSDGSDYSPGDYMAYACGIVSQYLPATLAEDLKDSLGIKEPLHEKPDLENQPAAKKIKLESLTPDEDYSQAIPDLSDSKKTNKLTAAQKKLDKVDKKGIKNIASFFSPKAKAK